MNNLGCPGNRGSEVQITCSVALSLKYLEILKGNKLNSYFPHYIAKNKLYGILVSNGFQLNKSCIPYSHMFSDVTTFWYGLNISQTTEYYFTHTHTHARKHAHKHTHAHIHIHTNTRTHTHTHMHTHTHTNTHAYTHKSTHTNTHTYARTRMHTQRIQALLIYVIIRGVINKFYGIILIIYYCIRD